MIIIKLILSIISIVAVRSMGAGLNMPQNNMSFYYFYVRCDQDQEMLFCNGQPGFGSVCIGHILLPVYADGEEAANTQEPISNSQNVTSSLGELQERMAEVANLAAQRPVVNAQEPLSNSQDVNNLIEAACEKIKPELSDVMCSMNRLSKMQQDDVYRKLLEPVFAMGKAARDKGRDILSAELGIADKNATNAQFYVLRILKVLSINDRNNKRITFFKHFLGYVVSNLRGKVDAYHDGRRFMKQACNIKPETLKKLYDMAMEYYVNVFSLIKETADNVLDASAEEMATQQDALKQEAVDRKQYNFGQNSTRNSRGEQNKRWIAKGGSGSAS